MANIRRFTFFHFNRLVFLTILFEGNGVLIYYNFFPTSNKRNVFRINIPLGRRNSFVVVRPTCEFVTISSGFCQRKFRIIGCRKACWRYRTAVCIISNRIRFCRLYYTNGNIRRYVRQIFLFPSYVIASDGSGSFNLANIRCFSFFNLNRLVFLTVLLEGNGVFCYFNPACNKYNAFRINVPLRRIINFVPIIRPAYKAIAVSRGRCQRKFLIIRCLKRCSCYITAICIVSNRIRFCRVYCRYGNIFRNVLQRIRRSVPSNVIARSSLRGRYIRKVLPFFNGFYNINLIKLFKGNRKRIYFRFTIRSNGGNRVVILLSAACKRSCAHC